MFKPDFPRDLSGLIQSLLPLHARISADPTLSFSKIEVSNQEKEEVSYQFLSDYPNLLEIRSKPLPLRSKLFLRCLKEGNVKMLDAFKHNIPSSEKILMREEWTKYPIENLEWLSRSGIAVHVPISHILDGDLDPGPDILELFKSHITPFPMSHLENIEKRADILGWFLNNADSLLTARTSPICLDHKSAEVISAWLTSGIVPAANFYYDSLVDEANTPELLDLCFKHFFFFFKYSADAIGNAIAADNYLVLKWWERKEEEECLQMLLPMEVSARGQLSERVLNWAQSHGVALRSYQGFHLG